MSRSDAMQKLIEKWELDYLWWLLKAYETYKKEQNSIMNSLCYYIDKGNNKKMRERYVELINIIDKIDGIKEWVIKFYEKYSWKKIIPTRILSRKELNKIKNFLDFYKDKKWKTENQQLTISS